jgi:geranylgeranyl pyrophosphate synthase
VSANAAAAQLGEVLDRGGPRLRALLEATERRLGEVAEGYGTVLAANVSQTLEAGGKRLRPILVFVMAGEAGGDALVDAAASVELLHMATLVHDDVLDRAELRRGRATVFASGGRGAATATGDLLFSRAFAVLAATGNADAVRALSEASSALARGELLQREDAWSGAVSVERYLERCRLKTARLFEAACRLGAILGDPGPGAADSLARFGEGIGLAFQLFDDVLDVAGPPEVTGKPRGTDLLDGTVTLPLIVARERDPELAALDLRGAARDGETAAALCDRIAATGALDETRDRALDHVRRAKGALDGVDLSAAQRELLEVIADGVADRRA